MMFISNWFSQTRALRTRKERGLHPVDELSRFRMLACALFCGICVSLSYTYELFATRFRQQFQLSAGDLSTVNTVGLVFNYLLFPYSFIFEALGPFVNFMICLACGVIGTVCLALTLSGAIPGNTATLTVFYAFLNIASGLIDTSYVPTLLANFPRNRGPVVCLGKMMAGLGSSLFACLSTTFFKGNIIGFIYFLTCFIIAVTMCAGFVIVLPPYCMNWWRLRHKSPGEVAELEATRALYHHKCVPARRIIVAYAVVLAMLLFFTIEAPVVAYARNISRGSEICIGVISVVLVFCFFVMALPLRCLGGVDEPAPSEEEARAITQLYEVRREPSSTEREAEEEATMDKPVVNVPEAAAVGYSPTNLEPVAAEEGETEARKDLQVHQDPRYQGDSVMEYFKLPDLWFILLQMLCVMPIGVMVLYNGSTVSIAKTGKARSVETSALYTAFLGLGNSVGRMAFGLFEAYVQHQRGRGGKLLVTSAMFVGPIVATVGGVLLLVLPGKVILFPFILIYLVYGFSFGFQAIIFSCLFESFHSTLYSMSYMVVVISVICFNRLLLAMYVDMQHKRLGLDASQECNQEVCIRVPFIISTCLAAVGLIFSALVHVRYTRFVARVRKQREEKAAESATESDLVELQELQ